MSEKLKATDCQLGKLVNHCQCPLSTKLFYKKHAIEEQCFPHSVVLVDRDPGCACRQKLAQKKKFGRNSCFVVLDVRFGAPEASCVAWRSFIEA
jgi:hypothetical protein